MINRDLLKSVITVNVGTDSAKEMFVIHKELICHHSAFFRTAMQGTWIEAKRGLVELPDDSPVIFWVFQNWLYSQQLRLEDSQEQDYLLHINMFIFGDKIGVPAFQNAALDRLPGIFSHLAILPPDGAIKRTFSGTVTKSPLRELLVDIWINSSGRVVALMMQCYPQEFLAELVTKLMGKKSMEVRKIETSFYHVSEVVDK